MPKEKLMGVRVTPETYERLRKAATADGRTVSNLVQKLVQEYLDGKRS